MDLYSADMGAIQEGNMRSQAITQANSVVQQHNDKLAGTIAGLKSQERTANIEGSIRDAIGGIVASGKISGKVNAYKNWNADQKAPNPTSQEQNKMEDNTENESGAETTEEPKSNLKDTGDGIFVEEDESKLIGGRVKSGIKSALGVSDEALETAGKGLGEITSVGLAGMDIYKDIKAGGIAGDNWASKASNVLQIGGAIADLGGTIFPPLALLGGAMDIASGVSGEVGDMIDDKKQEQKTDDLQQSQTETQVAQVQQAPASTGRIDG